MSRPKVTDRDMPPRKRAWGIVINEDAAASRQQNSLQREAKAKARARRPWLRNRRPAPTGPYIPNSIWDFYSAYGDLVSKGKKKASAFIPVNSVIVRVPACQPWGRTNLATKMGNWRIAERLRDGNLDRVNSQNLEEKWQMQTGDGLEETADRRPVRVTRASAKAKEKSLSQRSRQPQPWQGTASRSRPPPRPVVLTTVCGRSHEGPLSWWRQCLETRLPDQGPRATSRPVVYLGGGNALRQGCWTKDHEPLHGQWS
uniref:Integrase core domain containing protein n=1 Tax=Solanum tuberosum TaxID=4113 RepID=M1DTB1_SOLTU